MPLHVNDLQVKVKNQQVTFTLLQSISFRVGKNEKIALVGPSGSGKTTLLESITQLRYWDTSFQFGGEIVLDTMSLFQLDSRTWESIRGKEISYIFQEPMACFNPLMTIGEHLESSWKAHNHSTSGLEKKEVLNWLEKVKLEGGDNIVKSFPHQLSGGQLQRVMVISALWHKPGLVLADEPFSSLDDTNKKIILSLIDEEIKSHEGSVIMATHDPDILNNWATRVIVMENGAITLDCLRDEFRTLAGKNDFINSLVHLVQNQEQIKREVNGGGSTDETVLEAIQISKSYPSRFSETGKKWVFSDFNMKLKGSSSLGISGPSGCGKSTLARILLKLERFDSGRLFWMEKEVTGKWEEDLRKLRGQVQIVFQDTNLSLPPFQTVQKLLEEVSSLHGSSMKHVLHFYESMGLSQELLERLPSQLSGGQRQRICVVRALISNPKVLVLDEAISMLDPDHQCKVVNVLVQQQKKTGMSLVFISHDKSWIESLCQNVVLL